MSITPGLPNDLPNNFNLFGTRIPGIDIAEELCSRAFMKAGNKLKIALQTTLDCLCECFYIYRYVLDLKRR